MVAGAGAVALAESIEHVRKKLRGDADAVVGNADLEVRPIVRADTLM